MRYDTREETYFPAMPRYKCFDIVWDLSASPPSKRLSLSRTIHMVGHMPCNAMIFLIFHFFVSLKDLSAILLKAIVVWCDHGKDNTKYTFKEHPPPFWPHIYLNSISCFSPTMSIRAAVKTGNRHYQRENCHHREF